MSSSQSCDIYRIPVPGAGHLRKIRHDPCLRHRRLVGSRLEFSHVSDVEGLLKRAQGYVQCAGQAPRDLVCWATGRPAVGLPEQHVLGYRGMRNLCVPDMMVLGGKQNVGKRSWVGQDGEVG